MMVAGLLLVPLRALGIPQTRWVWVLGPALAAYAAATGLSASALRACVMAVVFVSAHAFRRRPDAATNLAVAALLILAVAPGELFEAGFQLSFVVVAGLLWLATPLSGWLSRRVLPDAISTEEDAWGWVRSLMRALIALVSVTLAAWVASLPLAAWHFNLVSPSGLVANLLVVPLVSLLMLCGSLSLVAGWLWAPLAEVYNHASRWLVDVLLVLVSSFQQLPGSYTYVRAPPWWCVAAFYLALVTGRLGGRRLRIASAVAGVAALLAPGVWPMLQPRMEVAVRGSARGVTVLLDGPGAEDILVDPGPRHRAPQLIRWLQSRGVDRLHAVVLTRPGMGVSAALPALLEEMPVAELWLPAGIARPPAVQALLDSALAKGVVIRARARGEAGQLDGGMCWRVLHPDPGRSYARQTAGSLVLHAAWGSCAVLVHGEPDAARESDVLSGAEDPAACIEVLTGVGAMGPGTPDWRAAVRSALVFWPVDTGNRASLDSRVWASRSEWADARVERLEDTDEGVARWKMNELYPALTVQRGRRP